MERFNLKVDRLVAVWQRETHSVEANSQEEAIEILKGALKEAPLNGSSELSSYFGCDTLHETETMMPSNLNSNGATLEIIDGDTEKTLWTNKE
jgi:hypothetical protein